MKMLCTRSPPILERETLRLRGQPIDHQGACMNPYTNYLAMVLEEWEDKCAFKSNHLSVQNVL